MQLWDDDVGDGGKHSGSSTVSRVSLSIGWGRANGRRAQRGMEYGAGVT